MYFNNTILGDNTYIFLCKLIQDNIDKVLADIDRCKYTYKNNYKYTVCYRDLLLRYKYLLVLKMEFNNYKFERDTISICQYFHQNSSKSANDYLDKLRKVGK